jgi:PI-3-kinase-related kinase SMG-1
LISCPRNAKAWSHFASWCYKRGRRATEWEEEGPVLGLSDIEKEKVAAILGPEATLEQCEAVISTLQELRQYKPEDDDTLDIVDTFRSLLPETTPDLENKLAQLTLLWGQRTQSHCYYHACAISYFKFLQLCEGQDNSDDSLAEVTLTATLRLLRLIVKHATSLQDVLESGLALTPTTPWKGIIPQLFARLSHPEMYVRRRISELLCRLASDAPHLILFPAVVGCSLSKATLKDDNLLSIQETEDDGEDNEDEIEEEEEEDDEDSRSADDSQSSMLRSCFLAMVDTLSQQAPASTAQVRLLVSELRRITVLWDELWLGCLIQHRADITRRLSQIESEIKQCEENDSLSPELKVQLSREKYRIIMKPIIVMLEHLQSITSAPAETSHEKAFQAKYLELINEAVKNLKNPPENKPIKAQTCWQPFREIQIKLQQQAQRKGAHTLKLTEISPQLANLKDSAIAMPGLSQSQPLVTIAAIENIISVLPTKTRPKKLVLSGSDGRNYTYLFKG